MVLNRVSLLVKVDKKNLKIIEDEEYDDISLEDLVEGIRKVWYATRLKSWRIEPFMSRIT
jgi:hypothetical protein